MLDENTHPALRAPLLGRPARRRLRWSDPRALLLAGVLVLAGACGDGDSKAAGPSATPPLVPSPTEAGRPQGTATAPPQSPVFPASSTPSAALETPTMVPTQAAVTATRPAATATTAPPATSTPVPTAVPSYPAGATIELTGAVKFFFRPDHLDLAAGGTVTFVWAQGVHNVISTGALRFADHPDILTSGAFSAAFPQPGTYTFACEVHPDTMSGSITVH